jgi:hypothetical protein
MPATRAMLPLVLFAAITISLMLAIVFGFLQLIWLGQPLGNEAAIAAFICLYVFGGASVVLLVRELRAQGKADV